MATRAETAAATRRALLDAAGSLLDSGGPDAVTLRAVGAAAGVSRGAPYGHFSTKDELLTAVAAEQWALTAERLAALRADERLAPGARLEQALTGWLQLARSRPHLYVFMFAPPSPNPDALIAAANEAQDEFLALVSDSTQTDDPLRVAALLLATTHGVAGLEQAGQLGTTKWGMTGAELLGLAIGRLAS
ncbi:TetR/AcrR family transcriptional regulator [Isoptericola halotolerans]|uniref:AcrR family transcriptional regulator n=1 Tax=Isoptericola halotolerans TaxID=300560 RepID=A0ABX2A0B4_9MICO|nr:TetR/AcrR family transcriptional regulator [Isoptericola halotolerans]NOV96099.1 AcrR family transcriptional regulator [Isoptericola halotolerans]